MRRIHWIQTPINFLERPKIPNLKLPVITIHVTEMKNSPLESKSRLRPCLSCGREFRREFTFCPNCGAARGRLEEIGIEDERPHATFPHFTLLESAQEKRMTKGLGLLVELIMEKFNTSGWRYSYNNYKARRKCKNALAEKVIGKGAYRAQKVIVLIGLGIILVMLAIPPWISSSGFPRGYYFILLPPQRASVIDTTRLAIQIIFMIVMTGGVVYALQGRDTKNKE